MKRHTVPLLVIAAIASGTALYHPVTMLVFTLSLCGLWIALGEWLQALFGRIESADAQGKWWRFIQRMILAR